ncbi:MAG: hypothetical protein QM537_03690 [Candidatus Symbiobacter sp.]|nr:hypothetical protein [Candidatus Symbiobacter sp.]
MPREENILDYIKSAIHSHHHREIDGDVYIHHEDEQHDFKITFASARDNHEFYLFRFENSATLKSIFVKRADSELSLRSLCDLLMIIKSNNEYFAVAIEFKNTDNPDSVKFGLQQAKHGIALFQLILTILTVDNKDVPKFKAHYFVMSRQRLSRKQTTVAHLGNDWRIYVPRGTDFDINSIIRKIKSDSFDLNTDIPDFA